MKNKITALLSIVLILCAVGSFASCAQWDPPYETLDGEVRIKYDANGGMFAGITTEFYMVDVFELDSADSTSDGKRSVPLLDPSDGRRPKGGFEVSRTPVTVKHENGEEEKISYFLAGWYRVRELRVNENGEKIDDYGELCSVSGRPQGYIYSGRFDFEKDRLEIDPNADFSEGTYYATLYAAWVPYFNYEFYAKNGEAFELIKREQLINLTLPEWNSTTGKLTMNSFPSVPGKTFAGAYLDEAMTEEMKQGASGTVNYERGIIEGDAAVKIYTDWLDGTWYKITTAKQLADNASLNGNYLICADLDFSSMPWPSVFTKGEFKGSLVAEGGEFSLKGISVTQKDTSITSGGIFGTLGEGATLSGLSFESAIYTVEKGGRTPETAYGLLCGSAAGNVTVENVKVTGKIVICDDVYNNQSYSIGLVCGNGELPGVDMSGIDCVPENASSTVFTIEIDRTNGTVKLKFNA